MRSLSVACIPYTAMRLSRSIFRSLKNIMIPCRSIIDIVKSVSIFYSPLLIQLAVYPNMGKISTVFVLSGLGAVVFDSYRLSEKKIRRKC